MKNLWIALIVAVCVSSVHFAGEAELRSPVLSRIIDVVAVAAFPGTLMAQIISDISGGSSHITASLAFVFMISVLVNSLFYWAAVALISRVLLRR